MTFTQIIKRAVTNTSLQSRVKAELLKAEHTRLDLLTALEEARVSIAYNTTALEICEQRIARLRGTE